MATTLDQYRTNMAKNASQSRERISDKIIFDMPVSVDAEFSSALRTVLVEATTASWEFWYGLLMQFKEREGHCRVPNSFKLNEFDLGSWVSNQRSKADRLSVEHHKRLDDIGFVWDILAEKWEEGFNHLKSFRGREGHSRVPKGHIEEGYKLFNWVSVQRRFETVMNHDRKTRLDEIDFAWDHTQDFWDYAYSVLHKYYLEYAHTRVPARSSYENFQLGQWVSNQRSRRNNLSEDQINRLNNINFNWSPFDDAFERGLEKLRLFIEINGHTNPSARDVIHDFKLGSWATVIRANKNKLTDERVALLEQLGFE
jgi:hypothetical protein